MCCATIAGNKLTCILYLVSTSTIGPFSHAGQFQWLRYFEGVAERYTEGFPSGCQQTLRILGLVAWLMATELPRIKNVKICTVQPTKGVQIPPPELTPTVHVQQYRYKRDSCNTLTYHIFALLHTLNPLPSV